MLDAIGRIQASALQSKSALASEIQDLQGQLQTRADDLAAKGLSSVADKVRAVADRVGELATAVSGSDPGAVVTAAAQVADAIRNVPGCPTPTATPSA